MTFDIRKDSWFVEEKFYPRRKVTERIYLLLQTAGFEIYPSDLADGIHSTLKQYPWLAHVLAHSHLVPRPHMYVMTWHSNAKDFRTSYGKKQDVILTKKQLERALLKLIKDGN